MNETSYFNLLASIDRLLETGSSVIMAIDGRCGAGKTTLTRKLQQHYGCAVIPMDHFFLRPEQRTNLRLSVPGENTDHERFLEEVLLPLRQEKSFSYRPFDCSQMALGEAITVIPGKLTVIEGSYSCHPRLWNHYDLRVFITVDPQEQMHRLIQRNGSYARVFLEKWIPLEEIYFKTYNLEQRCDLSLTL